MKRRIFNVTLTLVIAAMAVFAALSLYRRYLTAPWTRDCQVRANVIGIAPRISGPVIRVAVRDNQEVKMGDLLFEIDPADYRARVEVAQAEVLNTEANLKQKEQDFSRQRELYEHKVNTIADFQNAQDAVSAGQAQVASAKSNLTLAQLNLGYTKISAPVAGMVTNMNVSPGAYVNAGEQLTALVDASSYWIAAYFKETQLPAIRIGQKAKVSLLGYGKTPLLGVVDSIGWGIHLDDGSGASSQLLPTVNQTVDWVRLPQRFPVRIHVPANPDLPLRIGETVSVTMIVGGNDDHGPSVETEGAKEAAYKN
jgi:multidrug resistance efflux pump